MGLVLDDNGGESAISKSEAISGDDRKSISGEEFLLFLVFGRGEEGLG